MVYPLPRHTRGKTCRKRQISPSSGLFRFPLPSGQTVAVSRDFNPQMATPKLENYLRTYRKQSGLTQGEVGFLLGSENGDQVSRYERRRRLPPLETALACEEIFGVPVSELFAGVRQAAGRDIAKRRLALRARLQAKTPRASGALLAAHKLRSLGERERPVVANHDAPTT